MLAINYNNLSNDIKIFVDLKNDLILILIISAYARGVNSLLHIRHQTMGVVEYIKEIDIIAFMFYQQNKYSL